MSKTQYKKYPAYKDSGIEWIGEIPEHWEIQKLKYIASVTLSNVDKKSEESEQKVRLCNYLDVYYNDYITPDFNFMEATATPEQIKRFLLKRGDVLITKDSEDWKDIAVPAYITEDLENTLCGYHLAHIKSKDGDINGNYLFYAFRSNSLNHQFTISANGITRYGIGKYDIENSLFILPQLSEQQAIAYFLDRKTALIDTLIAKKKRQIELLKEQRQAVINQAVTKGLDPNCEMKDSGIEWLGKIPKHWEIKKLKLLCSKIGDGIHTTPKYVDSSNIYFINGNNLINGQIVIQDSTKCVDDDEYEKYRIELQQGTILLSINGTIGNQAFYNKEKVVLGKSAAYMECKEELDNYFFSYVLKTHYIYNYFEKSLSGTTIKNLSLYTINNTPVVFPTLKEQKVIVESLNRTIKEVNSAINKAEKQIQLLQEYRTALISEAVTGKIDVREN